MKHLVAFLKSKQFFMQLGLVLLVIFLLVFLTIKWLASYTNHGQFVEVPDFRTKSISELESFVRGKNVSYEIIDSIYDPKEQAGIVLRQDPEANSKVKHNRKVYLYVTGMVAPQVLMPKLIDRSERQARLILSSYGLKAGKTTEKKADCNGCVLSQLIKGREIGPGKGVKKGSVVDLVVGKKDYFYSGENDSTGIQE